MINNIRKALRVLEPSVVPHFDNSPDFITSFSAWKMYPPRRTPTEKILLADLNPAEMAYFDSWLPMIAYGFDFNRIDCIAKSYCDSRIQELEYLLGQKRMQEPMQKNLRERYETELEGLSRQLRLTSDNVFLGASRSIHILSRKEQLELYLKNLAEAYTNLATLKSRYDSTSDETKCQEDNPAFSKILQVYAATNDPALLRVYRKINR